MDLTLQQILQELINQLKEIEGLREVIKQQQAKIDSFNQANEAKKEKL